MKIDEDKKEIEYPRFRDFSIPLSTVYLFSVDEAKNFLTVIGYNELMKISDHVFVYTNGIDEFHVQYVNEKYVFILDLYLPFSSKAKAELNEGK